MWAQKAHTQARSYRRHGQTGANRRERANRAGRVDIANVSATGAAKNNVRKRADDTGATDARKRAYLECRSPIFLETGARRFMTFFHSIRDPNEHLYGLRASPGSAALRVKKVLTFIAILEVKLNIGA